ncbi:MAG: RDD family protein [Actinomycetes bacterium]
MTTTDSGAAASPTRPRSRRYASWGRRAGGLFIDVLPALVLIGVAQALFFISRTDVATVINGVTYIDQVTAGPGIGYYLLMVLAIVYWFVNKGYYEGTTGRSLGKTVFRTRTLSSATGKPLGVGWGMVRALLVYVELALILTCVGAILWLWPLWDQRNQALLSDKATDAVVMRSHRRSRSDRKKGKRSSSDKKDSSHKEHSGHSHSESQGHSQ